MQGANLGVKLTDWALLRLRARHSNSVTGVQGEWNFNGDPILPPDFNQRARQNNLLASAQLAITGPSRWQHRFTGFEYKLARTNIQAVNQPDRVDPFGDQIDTPYHAIANINRAGFEYQGEYTERSWAHTTVGYEFEDENGTTGSLPDSLSHGVRLNHAVYGQQVLTLGRLSVVAGARYVHNESFGNRAVPRVALSLPGLSRRTIFLRHSLPLFVRYRHQGAELSDSLSETAAAFPSCPIPRSSRNECVHLRRVSNKALGETTH